MREERLPLHENEDPGLKARSVWFVALLGHNGDLQVITGVWAGAGRYSVKVTHFREKKIPKLHMGFFSILNRPNISTGLCFFFCFFSRCLLKTTWQKKSHLQKTKQKKNHALGIYPFSFLQN